MKAKKSIWKRLKEKRLSWGLSAILGVFVSGGLWQQIRTGIIQKKNNISAVEKKMVPMPLSEVSNPVLSVKYQTDTLARFSGILMYYSRGVITRNYVENVNTYRLQLPYFAHEDWHSHNNEIKYRSRLCFTPIEYYKLCMHDEISANIAALLTARYEYLAAPSKKAKKAIISRYKNTYLQFYFTAVEKGKIKPQSRLKADFEKEMSFIANATQDMWMKKYSGWYASAIYRMLQRYVGRLGLITDSKKSYNDVLNYMYTIGGVNFAEYMQRDINTTDDKVKLADQLRKIKTMRSGGLDIMNYVNNSYHLLEQTGFDHTREAFQNLLISAQLKYMLQDKTPEELSKNPQLVNLYFVKIMSKLRGDEGFKKLVLNYPLIAENRVNLMRSNREDKKVIRKMYEFKGIDLLSLIPSYKYEAMPVRGMETYSFYTNYAEDYTTAMLPEQYDNVSSHTYYSPIVRNTSYNAAGAAKQDRRRISSVQSIKIPNLHEPILTSAGADDYFQIIQCVREFEDMPQVLKDCNSAAQRKYWREHPENIAKYSQNTK